MGSEVSSGYRQSLKSLDTEEHIDLWFYRPIGYAWACVARRLGITPNAITIASIFLGIGAGIAFYYTNIWVNVVGMLLLIWANSFDSADGQLARMTKQYSRLGRILDGLSGDLWFIAIYAAICLRMNVTSPFFGEHPWLIWLIAATAGLFHAKQASTADYYRQFHLYFLKGESGSELDSSAVLRKKYSQMPWRGNFWSKLILFFYANYTANQEAMSPAMQALRRQLALTYHGGVASEAFRTEFRRGSLPLMKYTNILTFNWRSITLFIALFIGMPWLYFIAELTIFNGMAAYLIVKHERLCRRLTAELRDGKLQ